MLPALVNRFRHQPPSREVLMITPQAAMLAEDLRPDLWLPEPARAKEPLAEKEENSHV